MPLLTPLKRPQAIAVLPTEQPFKATMVVFALAGPTIAKLAALGVFTALPAIPTVIPAICALMALFAIPLLPPVLPPATKRIK